MRYVADKTTQVTGANRKGDALGPIKFPKGFYETKDPDEIELLDFCASDPNNPIGFDPKEE